MAFVPPTITLSLDCAVFLCVLLFGLRAQKLPVTNATLFAPRVYAQACAIRPIDRIRQVAPRGCRSDWFFVVFG
jgi:hypothetical protein